MTKIDQAKVRDGKEIELVMHPLIKEWFFSRFKDFSLPQLYGVMPIWERKNILISAPTGGTKTLTAFLAILNYLVTLASKNELEDKVYAVYVSPLKALSNDIWKNLDEPLAQIREIAEKNKIKLQDIRVALRTGDTTTSERVKQSKKIPHILVTTPESLAIILNSPKFKESLNALEFLIIDEIHALANKRGVHLGLSIERLEEYSKITPVRIGLSATIAPLEDIAGFLVGSDRDCLIANVEFNKKLDIEILTPVEDLIENGENLGSELYNLLDKLIQEHKTSLIFTNTRSATERVINHLKERYPDRYLEGEIGAHHSSLSKEARFDIEEKLRQGKLKVVVSSTSLELGIDIGYIDLVVLLSSPKSTARALQRIGRAGHKLHETAKGRFIVLDRDDLVECAVMKKEIIERKIDRVQIPKNCLDVLSQHVYGMAIARVWDVKEMFSLVKRSYCYSKLEYGDFLAVISYLAGEYALEDKQVYAKIWYDSKTGEIGKRGKLARVIYMTNIGTIPDESYISVVVSRGEKTGEIGKIDEGFLERLKPGDVFVLGGNKYQFLYTRGMKAYVSSSVARPPNIPAWFSEQLPLSFDLAIEISRFRGLIDEKIRNKKSPEEIKGFIEDWCYVNSDIAGKIYDYIKLQEKFSSVASDRKIVIEQYRGEKEYWIFGCLFGRRVNDALSRAVGFCLARLIGRDVELGINDNGFYVVGEKVDRERIEKAIKFLNTKNVEEILKEAIEKTESLRRRFRHCAARSLMILRNYKGRVRSAGKQQVKSGFLYHAIKKLTGEFPILQEARREVLEDAMDIENTKKVIDLINTGKMKIEFSETKIPSPFALNLIMQGHYDLIRMEDRVEFLKRIHKLHLGGEKDI